jgi:putative intracellular protease/amidase
MPNASLFIPQELADVDPARYIGVWLIGGYGAAFEFAGDPHIPHIIEHIWNTGGIVRAIACED